MVLVENYEAHSQQWAQCFNNPKRSDVVFEARDGQTFHCEKFVLEVASPHFEKLFSCGKNSTKYISAKDVDPAALKWILRSCYTADGELNDDNVVSVMLAANKYEIAWVSRACMKYLREDMGGPSATFKYSHDMQKWQEWKVPQSGWYHIVAMGAKAADQPNRGSRTYKSKGGVGAIVAGSFELKTNTAIQILTGGMSRPWGSNAKEVNLYTGGGGGTFVAIREQGLNLILAAGGGGSPNYSLHGSDANLGEDGLGSSTQCPGGKNGGQGHTGGNHGGGLGWKVGPAELAKPKSTKPNDTGGFGGGGSVCGGGGGYSGGGCGTRLSASGGAAGGGGSYISSKAVNSWKRVGNFGHGRVLIWRGKSIPSMESSLLDQFGGPEGGILGQSNEESTDSLEVLNPMRNSSWWRKLFK